MTLDESSSTQNKSKRSSLVANSSDSIDSTQSADVITSPANTARDVTDGSGESVGEFLGSIVRKSPASTSTLRSGSCELHLSILQFSFTEFN